MPATLDAWGGAELTVMVDGDDVSCDVLTATVDRSQNRLWDPPDAGVAQVVLAIGTDAQAADVGPVGAPVTVAVAYGAVERTLFTGNVQRRRLEATPIATDRIVLDCVDGFELLARVNLRADTGDPEHGDGESPNNRIARWLNEADWPIGDRALDSSTYTCPGTLLDGNVLRNIQITALADGGVFFIDGDGIATFLNWGWRTETGAVAAVFSDRKLFDWVPYSTAALHDDLDEVQNSVTGTRREHTTPGVPQTVENTTSVAAYGMRGDALDDLELDDDTQVGDRITALVTIAGMPSPRFDAIAVQPVADPSRMWPRTIPVTYGSLVAANRVWDDGTETAYYGHVIGEMWSFTPTDATVTWRVSGTGGWDANGPPRPPPCVTITPGGCIEICDGYPCDEDNYTVIFRDADGDPIGDPFPPGSLCEGICEIPEGAVEVCFENEFGVACIAIDDPRLEAILWVDVFDAGPSLQEKIDGDPINMAGNVWDTELDVIPGDNDAILNPGVTSDVVFGDHSTHVEAADFSGGWTVDFWFNLGTQLGADTTKTLLAMDSIGVQWTTAYQETGPYIAELEVAVIDDVDATHLSGPLFQLTDTDAWHHYVVLWDGDTDNLHVFVDGVEFT